MLHRIEDALIVEPGRARDQIEFIGRREFDVAIGIVEQLGEFRLGRRQRDDLWRDRLEQSRGFLFGFRCRAADDLRHLAQFLDAVALHHAFRTERDLQLAALALDIGMQPVGGSGKHRRAQHQQLAVGEMRQQRVDAGLHYAAHGIEEFVDRRADGDNDRAAARNLIRRVREHQSLFGQRLGQQIRRVIFNVGQAAAFEDFERIFIDVVDVDAGAAFREREHQRHADMAGAADHSDVRILYRCRRVGRQIGAKFNAFLRWSGRTDGMASSSRD